MERNPNKNQEKCPTLSAPVLPENNIFKKELKSFIFVVIFSDEDIVK